MYGPVNTAEFADLHWSEFVVFFIIMVIIVVLGVYPAAIIDFVKPSVTNLLELSSISTSLAK